MLEIVLGWMILEDRFLYLTPFHKSLHSLIMDTSSSDPATFKRSLSSLRETTTEMDLTRIIEPYLNPWWITASSQIENTDLFPDVLRFRNVVS